MSWSLLNLLQDVQYRLQQLLANQCTRHKLQSGLRVSITVNDSLAQSIVSYLCFCQRSPMDERQVPINGTTNNRGTTGTYQWQVPFHPHNRRESILEDCKVSWANYRVKYVWRFDVMACLVYLPCTCVAQKQSTIYTSVSAARHIRHNSRANGLTSHILRHIPFPYSFRPFSQSSRLTARTKASALQVGSRPLMVSVEPTHNTQPDSMDSRADL
jgi:hypothetical protein